MRHKLITGVNLHNTVFMDMVYYFCYNNNSIQVSLEEHRTPKTHKLKPNGENIPVTNESRDEYVNLYLNWVLNLAIYEQFRAFYFGFHSVCASNALIVSHVIVMWL